MAFIAAAGVIAAEAAATAAVGVSAAQAATAAALTVGEIASISSAVIGIGGGVATAQAGKAAAEASQGVQEASAFEVRQGATRRRVRERRVNEARLRQAASNTGTGGSSGEAGALSSLSTQFASSGSATVFAQQQGQKLGQIRTDSINGQALGNTISAVGGALGQAASSGLFD